MSHDPAPSAAGTKQQLLKIVFALTAVYLVAEVVGGLLTNSLALLADAGHMLTDVGGLGLALLAIRFAERPATEERTYGFYRVEILAAVVNAVILVLVSLYILYEAYERFLNPPKVDSGAMFGVALVGLVVNIVGIVLLRRGSEESLNLKGAYFEVLSDLLTSVGVIVAAIVRKFTGWYYADPLIPPGIGPFLFPPNGMLLREGIGVLLEGVPAEVNLAALREAMAKLPGVEGVHDLHVWSLTSGVNAMSAHVVIVDDGQHDEVLSIVHQTVTANFKIHHVTVQIENVGWKECEAHL